VWLAIILAVIWIFEGAAFILVHVFNVLLLFIFAGIVALILTPLVDGMERVRPFRGHRSFIVLLIYTIGLVIVAGAIMLVLPTVVAQAKGVPSLLLTIENQLRQHSITFSFSAVFRAVNGQQLGVALGVAAAFVSGLISGAGPGYLHLSPDRRACGRRDRPQHLSESPARVRGGRGSACGDSEGSDHQHHDARRAPRVDRTPPGEVTTRLSSARRVSRREGLRFS
jgi:hypothetical protein